MVKNYQVAGTIVAGNLVYEWVDYETMEPFTTNSEWYVEATNVMFGGLPSRVPYLTTDTLIDTLIDKFGGARYKGDCTTAKDVRIYWPSHEAAKEALNWLDSELVARKLAQTG